MSDLTPFPQPPPWSPVEYHVEQMMGPIDDRVSTLNALGQQGWKVVWSTPLPGGQIIMFMREAVTVQEATL